MAYNEKLADRVRELITLTHKKVEEKRMFGGLCFMVNEKMCIGVNEDRIMVRHDPALSDKLMEKEGAEPMNFTGRVMKGYVFVNEEVLETKKRLAYWVQLGLDFNKFAKSSKKATGKTKSKR